MPIPFLVPAGMMAVRIGGKWVLRKIVQRAARKAKEEAKKIKDRKSKEEAKKIKDRKARDAKNTREADKRRAKKNKQTRQRREPWAS